MRCGCTVYSWKTTSTNFQGAQKLTNCLVEAMKHFLDFDDTFYYLDVTDEIINEYMPKFLHPDPFEKCHDIEKDDEPIGGQPTSRIWIRIFPSNNKVNTSP